MADRTMGGYIIAVCLTIIAAIYTQSRLAEVDLFLSWVIAFMLGYMVFVITTAIVDFIIADKHI